MLDVLYIVGIETHRLKSDTFFCLFSNVGSSGLEGRSNPCSERARGLVGESVGAGVESSATA